MFDGADLSLAYGAPGQQDSYAMSTPIANLPMDSSVPRPEVSSSKPAMPMISKASESHALPPDTGYAPPMAMFAQQKPAAPVLLPPSESFWDRMTKKKAEVLKLVALSMVVLIGISMDRVITHYLTAYVGRAFLTEMQEFVVRLSYPVLAILALWLLKTSM